jgi:ElaB/YqjD/DUF883 family membrane-anchored ribosome-binding protein
MSYPNGNTTVADVKKSVSAGAQSLASEFKSDAKSAASKVERAIDSAAGKSSPKSIAETVLNSALAFLPEKSTEEARTMLTNTVQDVQSGISTARESATTFVRKYPLYSLLGAAAIGAGAAMLVTMRNNSLATDTEDSVRFDA